MLTARTSERVGAAFFVVGLHDGSREPAAEGPETGMADPNAAPNPSTTTKPATPPALLAPDEMSDAQLTEFFAKGPIEKTDAPAGDTPSADQPADSATAKAVDPAASTDASTKPAASETATPEKKQKGKGLEARNADLRAEIEENARLLRLRREQRDELARSPEPPKPKADAKPDSSPAATDLPTDADFKRYLAMPGAPKAEAFDGDLDAYTAAMGAFIAKQMFSEQFDAAFNERQSRLSADQQREREFTEAAAQAEERAKADEARNPGWREQIDPALAAIPPMRGLEPGQRPNAMNFIKDQVMFEADHPVSLMVFLSSDEGKAWAMKLTRLAPERIVREIAIKDASFAASPDDDELNPSLVSSAPPPGETLGRKASKPVDPLKSAIESNDPEAFIDQRNKALVSAGKR